MNIPNILTVFRLCLVPVYFGVFFSGPEHRYLAFMIIVLAGITDVADGYIARKYNLVTDIGKMLDPLADKLMMVSVFITLLVAKLIPIWGAIVFFARDLGMIFASIFFVSKGKKTVQANFLGKLSTVLFYTFFLFIFFDWPYAIHILCLALTVAITASINYIIQFRRLNHMGHQVNEETTN